MVAGFCRRLRVIVACLILPAALILPEVFNPVSLPGVIHVVTKKSNIKGKILTSVVYAQGMNRDVSSCVNA